MNQSLQNFLLASIKDPSLLAGIDSIHEAPLNLQFNPLGVEYNNYFKKLLLSNKNWKFEHIFVLKCNIYYITMYSDAIVISIHKNGLDIIISHKDFDELKSLAKKPIEQIKLLANFM